MKMKAIFNEARPRAESNLLYFDANFKTWLDTLIKNQGDDSKENLVINCT
jgi:hypothetical protein